MSSVPNGMWLEPERLTSTSLLTGGLLFWDKMKPAEAKGAGFGSLQLPFGRKKKSPGEGGPSDLAVLDAAGARGASHAFLLVDAADVDETLAAVERLGSRPPTTVIAPSAGVSCVPTKGWVQKPIQDHEGVLVGGVVLRPGYEYDDDGNGRQVSLDTASDGGQSLLPLEDLAEVAVQCALRLSHTEEEGAPPLRVVRVSADDRTLAERPVVNYDTVIGGPKFRASQGTVSSADWTEMLKPFGVTKRSDPNDWRLLIDA
jgi:hypothetical protein